jgi:hypothetical protein
MFSRSAPVEGAEELVKGTQTLRATAEWPQSELQQIGETDDLHISPFRDDGRTYGTPTWIWSVVLDDALYVRAYHGEQSRWYQAAVRQMAGRIRAAGMTKDVIFEAVDASMNRRVDDAYRRKYQSSPYLAPMIGTRAFGDPASTTEAR